MNDDYYDTKRFQLKDLENMTLTEKLKNVQRSSDTYNLIKNELIKGHRTRGGLGNGGLAESQRETRIISWEQHAEYPWIDTMVVAVLPTAYPVLDKSIYDSITQEQLYGSEQNASYRALARYGALVSVGYNWTRGDTTEEMAEYDSIRSREVIYGVGKRPDHRSVQGWRKRLKGIIDSNGATERTQRNGERSSLNSLLWLDPTGAFSISYPETADTMARMLSAMVPPGSSVIDMTACMGGNTAYFSYYFQHVTAIEIAPHRQEVLEHNLRLLHPGKESMILTTTMEQLIETPSDRRPLVSILIGDSLDILTKSYPYETMATSDSIAQVLFLDPPWGGPNYMNLPRPLQLEMITRDKGGVSATEFLRGIVVRIRDEQQMIPYGKGILSGITHIGMKVPDEYDIVGLRTMLKTHRAVATDPFLIPDRTRKNRVYFIIMTLL